MLKLRSDNCFSKLVIGLFMSGTLFTCSSKLFAQDDVDWWFDVEVIAFARTGNDSQISEDFSKAMFELKNKQAIDLFTPALSSLYEGNNPLTQLPICDKQSIAIPKYINLASPYVAHDLPSVSFDEMEGVLVDHTGGKRETHSENEGSLLLEDVSQNDETFIVEVSNQLSSDWLKPIPEQIPICERTELDEFHAYLYQLGMFSYEYELRDINSLIDSTPRRYNTGLKAFTGTHYLLPDEDLDLIDYASSLYKQRNVRTLLHTSWRQPVVFGEENARYYRVFAGNRIRYQDRTPTYEELNSKYSPKTNINEEDSKDSSLFFTELKTSLISPENVDWASIENINDAIENQDMIVDTYEDTWELDGQIKVYLRYINRIPYLHLDNEFMLSQLDVIPEGYPTLSQFPLKQRRRIISKQIHYFDHPKFGLIIRLERFEPPQDLEEEEQQ
ncbi:CsiV family protein [Glaciecola sp. KUL10]|uniref:CsiV family protein n=1 Tax=Glaciecola sp. (strain KUL10) TaxID=2161813 RepID=UPI000D789153|nr:CsiV family protein [Glaciecola sp. KUL10]GBL03091.1 hypothetical protein KUL10_03710 [Glaciecola sp. KUL10]